MTQPFWSASLTIALVNLGILQCALGSTALKIAQSGSKVLPQVPDSLKVPSADLFNERGQRLEKHYAGPTWEILKDQSKVVGVVSAKVNASQTDSIPWLLLKAKSHQGKGILSLVNWIQRLETVGGKAPKMGCDKTRKNAEIQVPYTANYYFYRSISP
jgi:Protein of unknown function (DUF3455)